MPWIPKVTADDAAVEEAEKKQPKRSEKKEKGEKGAAKGKGKGGKEKGGYESRGYEAQSEKGKGKDKGKGKKGYSQEAGDSSYKGGKKGAESGKGGKKGGKKGGDSYKGRSGDDTEKTDRPARSEDMRRQATAHAGTHCNVKKHSSMGCAIVTLNDANFRKVLVETTAVIEIDGRELKVKAHQDKDSKEDIPTDVFVGWGHKAEKANPISEKDLADYFDMKYDQFVNGGGAEAAKRAAAQRTAQVQAQWAATAGLGGRPPGPPLAAAPRPAVAQASLGGMSPQQVQQQQQMAAYQAHMMRQQQAMYIQAMQAQQQQQLWLQHMQAQKEAEAAAAQRKKAAGYKAAYRVPTDEEVKAKLESLSKMATPEKQEQSPEAELAAPASTEEAPPTAPPS